MMKRKSGSYKQSGRVPSACDGTHDHNRNSTTMNTFIPHMHVKMISTMPMTYLSLRYHLNCDSRSSNCPPRPCIDKTLPEADDVKSSQFDVRTSRVNAKESHMVNKDQHTPTFRHVPSRGRRLNKVPAISHLTHKCSHGDVTSAENGARFK